MRLTIISGVSVPATRRWLVIAPPRNPVRTMAPSTQVAGSAFTLLDISCSASSGRIGKLGRAAHSHSMVAGGLPEMS